MLNPHVLNTQELYERSYSIKPRPSELKTDVSTSITPSPPSSRSWRELLETAMVPEEDIDIYMQKLQASAIDINQVGALDKKVLRDLGFKWGHFEDLKQHLVTLRFDDCYFACTVRSLRFESATNSNIKRIASQGTTGMRDVTFNTAFKLIHRRNRLFNVHIRRD